MSSELETKIDRLIAVEEIRQLAYRYALVVDAKDIDTLVTLFSEKVKVSKTEQGREALRRFWEGVLCRFGTTIHLVGNHIVEYGGGNEATGLVYCRPEHELDGKWIVMCMTYQDRYVKEGGRWLFKSRMPRPWYGVDVLERPNAGKDWLRWPRSQGIPSAMEGVWPSFDAFFKRVGVERGSFVGTPGI